MENVWYFGSVNEKKKDYDILEDVLYYFAVRNRMLCDWLVALFSNHWPENDRYQCNPSHILHIDDKKEIPL